MTASAREANHKNSLYELNLQEIERQLLDLGQPAYRARQIWDWLYRQYAGDIDQMHNLPRGLREKLNRLYTLDIISPVIRMVCPR